MKYELVTKCSRGVTLCVRAEEVLLSPEVVEVVGDACALQHCAGGHALLLGMTGEVDMTPKAPAAGSRPQAGRELAVLPAGLQQLAVQVHTHSAVMSSRARVYVLKGGCSALVFCVLPGKLAPALGGYVGGMRRGEDWISMQTADAARMHEAGSNYSDSERPLSLEYVP